MIDFDKIKVRKITYNHNGFQKGELLPEFAGSIKDAFNHYSKLWMEEHCDKDGNLYDYINEKDASYIDEFTVLDNDYFYIGVRNSYAYEGITDDYKGYGCELDDYGFEKMYNTDGKETKYFDNML
jgi:hypothetical protein